MEGRGVFEGFGVGGGGEGLNGVGGKAIASRNSLRPHLLVSCERLHGQVIRKHNACFMNRSSSSPLAPLALKTSPPCS